MGSRGSHGRTLTSPSTNLRVVCAGCRGAERRRARRAVVAVRGGRRRERARQRGDGARRREAGPAAGRELHRGAPGDPARVTRIRWGGSLLEEARLHGAVELLTVQPHAVGAEGTCGRAAVEPFTPDSLGGRPGRARRRARRGAGWRRIARGGEGRRLRRPRCRLAEGFAIVEELAALLGGAVGCSRVVTSAGWRPHTDQVGQTGTKISPDLYIPCGISGATQHIAGCRGAKRIIADQRRPGGADLRERRLRRDRRPARDPARDLRRDQEGEGSITVFAGALALAALLAVSGALFARRAWLLWRLVRMRQAGRALRRPAAARCARRRRSSSASGSFPAPRPRRAARGHLLGLPRAPADDRDRDDRRRRPPLDVSVAGAPRVVRVHGRPLRRSRARRRPGGVPDPQGERPARFRGSHLGEADLILGADRRRS